MSRSSVVQISPTDILFLEFTGQMALDEGGLAGTAIPD